jgi:hypothetical protein
MQTLERRIFRSETQRPSGVQLWQQPDGNVIPVVPFRLLPLDEHDASYFAASAKTAIFSSTFIALIPHTAQHQKRDELASTNHPRNLY